jgi:hypothetical protein
VPAARATAAAAASRCVDRGNARPVQLTVFFEHSFGKIEQGNKDDGLVNVRFSSRFIRACRIHNPQRSIAPTAGQNI